jgi:hypothetical protein
MRSYRALCCALSLLIAAAPAVAAQKKAAAKKKAPPGRTETLACRLGTEDRHARIAVVVIKGKTDSFAYYSKWKPRTCSIYLQRNRDPYSKWADNGKITTVSLEKGAFLIEHKASEYHFSFRDIDRERYCGMEGVINGSLTIKRGNSQCVLEGDIMVEGTPLGHVHAHLKEADEPPAPGAAEKAAARADTAVTTPAASAPAPAATAIAPAASATPPPPTAPTATATPPSPTAPAATATPAETATAPVATASPVSSPAESDATGSAPVTSPAATAPEAAPAPAEASAPQPAASGQSQGPMAQQPGVAETVGSPSATRGADPETPPEAPSSNPFSAFFRSLNKERPAEEQMP